MINTSLLDNKIYVFIFCFLIILLKSNMSFSHECILKDTTPKEITIYNSCLSQKNSKYNLDAKKVQEMEQKIKKLENENLLLKISCWFLRKKFITF